MQSDTQWLAKTPYNFWQLWGPNWRIDNYVICKWHISLLLYFSVRRTTEHNDRQIHHENRWTQTSLFQFLEEFETFPRTEKSSVPCSEATVPPCWVWDATSQLHSMAPQSGGVTKILHAELLLVNKLKQEHSPLGETEATAWTES